MGGWERGGFWRLRVADLWRWSGEISRAQFLVWGCLLFAVKYNLDRLVLKFAFGRDWSIANYFKQPFPWLNFSPAESPTEYAVLLAIALPFLWAGIALCARRLRSAGLPLWLTVLFVVPVLKWLLFLVLGLVPGKESQAGGPRPRGWLDRWLPKSTPGSALLAVGLSLELAIGGAVLGTYVLGDYGWGLFVGVPFCMDFFAALIHGARQRRRLGESLLVAFLAVFLAGSALLVFAFEGVICLVMAAPLALGLAAIGAVAGHMVQATWHYRPAQVFCAPFLAVPIMLGADHLGASPAPLIKVTTAVDVKASPERVWQYVVSFSELPPPSEALFKMGIAYPVRAEIQGRGVGAVRNCIFSTGPFVEPIEQWDEPRLLRFSVTQNPEPMQEWTPYRSVHPPHLKGFLLSESGQFLLTPLPGGYVHLEGATWYHHGMWPASYWQLWSDEIIHKIHLRVLNHVKRLAESSESASSGFGRFGE